MCVFPKGSRQKKPIGFGHARKRGGGGVTLCPQLIGHFIEDFPKTRDEGVASSFFLVFFRVHITNAFNL